jgi:hypothetical protein
MGWIKSLAERAIAQADARDGVNPNTAAGTGAQTSIGQEEDVPTEIDRPRIKGILEEMTMETIGQQLRERFFEGLKGSNKNAPSKEDSLEDLTGTKDVMDLDRIYEHKSY